MVKHIYIPPGNIYNYQFSISPASGVGTVSMVKIGTVQVGTTSTVTLTSPTAGQYSFSPANAGGYYAIIIPKSSTLLASVVLTYTVYSYPCPYNYGYTDVYASMIGCSIGSSSASTAPASTIDPYTYGYPCLANDALTLACTQCAPTYFYLQNGVCWFNYGCGTRQWVHFGVCNDVSATCGELFDINTGACIGPCKNSSYANSNGICSIPGQTITCNTGFKLVSGQCIP